MCELAVGGGRGRKLQKSWCNEFFSKSFCTAADQYRYDDDDRTLIGWGGKDPSYYKGARSDAAGSCVDF